MAVFSLLDRCSDRDPDLIRLGNQRSVEAKSRLSALRLESQFDRCDSDCALAMVYAKLAS